MDAVFLARLQFALTIGFHFIFPPLSIGIAWILVVIEWNGWRKNDPVYVRAGKFLAKLLAVNFALGVATGIVMEFQFGTNWAEYSKFVGDIFGAPWRLKVYLLSSSNPDFWDFSFSDETKYQRGFTGLHR